MAVVQLQNMNHALIQNAHKANFRAQLTLVELKDACLLLMDREQVKWCNDAVAASSQLMFGAGFIRTETA